MHSVTLFAIHAEQPVSTCVSASRNERVKVWSEEMIEWMNERGEKWARVQTYSINIQLSMQIELRATHKLQ